MKTNANASELEKALEQVNRQYKGNIEFASLIPRPRGCDFTLRVRDSKGPGARRGFTGRRMAKACWHAHGHFFEALLTVKPQAKIISRGNGVTITQDSGNWTDRNIGSLMQPMYFSEACDCGKA